MTSTRSRRSTRYLGVVTRAQLDAAADRPADDDTPDEEDDDR